MQLSNHEVCDVFLHGKELDHYGFRLQVFRDQEEERNQSQEFILYLEPVRLQLIKEILMIILD